MTLISLRFQRFDADVSLFLYPGERAEIVADCPAPDDGQGKEILDTIKE